MSSQPFDLANYDTFDFHHVHAAREALQAARRGWAEPAAWRQQVAAAALDLSQAPPQLSAIVLAGALAQGEVGPPSARSVGFHFPHASGTLAVSLTLTPMRPDKARRQQSVPVDMPVWPTVTSVPANLDWLDFIKGMPGQALKNRLESLLGKVPDDLLSCVVAGGALLNLAATLLANGHQPWQWQVDGVGDREVGWYQVVVQVEARPHSEK